VQLFVLLHNLLSYMFRPYNVVQLFVLLHNLLSYMFRPYNVAQLFVLLHYLLSSVDSAIITNKCTTL